MTDIIECLREAAPYPCAWWRLSTLPECRPVVTTDADEALMWRSSGLDVRGLYQRPSTALCHEAADEIERMRREREVFARWMAEACGVLFSVEEEAEDGGESLRMLRDRGLRLMRAVLEPAREFEPMGRTTSGAIGMP